MASRVASYCTTAIEELQAGGFIEYTVYLVVPLVSQFRRSVCPVVVDGDGGVLLGVPAVGGTFGDHETEVFVRVFLDGRA